MASKNQEIVHLISTAGTGHYYTKKRHKRSPKMEFRKYDPIAKKHVLYKEGKLKKLK